MASRIEIPGPPGFPIIGNLPAFSRDVLGTFLDGFQRYGDVVRFKAGPRRIVMLSHPDDVKEVLQERHSEFKRELPQAKRMLGDGLLTSDGQIWLKERRMLQPFFLKAFLANFVPGFSRMTDSMVANWRQQTSGPIDVFPEMQTLTMNIVSELLLGVEVAEVAAQLLKAFRTIIDRVNKRTLVNLPAWMDRLPTRSNRAYTEAQNFLDHFIYDLMRKREESGEKKNDLIGHMMTARDPETGETMTKQLIKDEIFTFLAGGHDTTAQTLAWALYFLTQYPEVQRRVHAEVEQVVGDRVAGFEELQRLDYTRCVVEETLRLYPPIAMFSRYSRSDQTFRGYHVPAETMIAVAPFVTHRHPRYWTDPETFDPGRFAVGADKDRPRFAYFPFGGGPRQCIGNQFALMESQIVIASIVRQFRLELAPDCQVTRPTGYDLGIHPMVNLHARMPQSNAKVSAPTA